MTAEMTEETTKERAQKIEDSRRRYHETVDSQTPINCSTLTKYGVWATREQPARTRVWEPFAMAMAGYDHCGPTSYSVWMFPAEAEIRGIIRWFREKEIPYRGTSLTPSPYDCTGRWWSDAIEVARQWVDRDGLDAGIWIVTQQHNCDV